MLKKLSIVILSTLFILPIAEASQLSHWLEKQEQKSQQREAEQRAKDLDFGDYDFRLQPNDGTSPQNCRNYTFRAHKDPYKHGTFSVCYDQ
jgi:hypothetical protein